MVEEESLAVAGQRMICPNALVACPYTSAGCDEKVARKDMEHHEKTRLQKHLKLLCERMLKLQQTQGSALSVVATASASASAGATAASPSVEDGYLSESESLPSANDSGLLVRAEEIRSLGRNFEALKNVVTKCCAVADCPGQTFSLRRSCSATCSTAWCRLSSAAVSCRSPANSCRPGSRRCPPGSTGPMSKYERFYFISDVFLSSRRFVGDWSLLPRRLPVAHSRLQ